MSDQKEIVGVIGSGSFGITIAKVLSENTDVLLFSRSKKDISELHNYFEDLDFELKPNIKLTNDYKEITEKCRVIFPVIPSSSFRSMISDLSPHLNPGHILIHATKGFDYSYKSGEINVNAKLDRKQVKTMSEVIKEESTCIRIGCLAGPNLAKEILAEKPAATVIASEFEEVIKLGIKLLSSRKFFVFGSSDIRGAEIAGAYKNIIALGSGLLGGLDLGTNTQSLMITRGLHEMIRFGKHFGTEGKAFLGTAGVGDLIATCTSTQSRNYTFGSRIAKGESLEDIIASSREVVEGVRSLKIVRHLAQSYHLQLPITSMIYSIIYEGFDVERAINLLMKYPFKEDVDFI